MNGCATVSFKGNGKGFLENLFNSPTPAPTNCTGGGEEEAAEVVAPAVEPAAGTPIVLERDIISDSLATIGLDYCEQSSAEAEGFYSQVSLRLIEYYKNGNFAEGTVEARIQTRLIALGVSQEYLVRTAWTTRLVADAQGATTSAEYTEFCDSVAEADRSVNDCFAVHGYGSITLTTTNQQLLDIINNEATFRVAQVELEVEDGVIDCSLVTAETIAECLTRREILSEDVCSTLTPYFENMALSPNSGTAGEQVNVEIDGYAAIVFGCERTPTLEGVTILFDGTEVTGASIAEDGIITAPIFASA